MADATQGCTYKTTVSYRSLFTSAEWIQEAPSSSAGVLPLANFTKVSLDPTANATLPGITNLASGGVGPDGLILQDPYGEVSVPSPVTRLDYFAACWGTGTPSSVTCSAPQ